MTRRIPLTTVAKAGLTAGYWSVATDLGGPARKANLRTSRAEIFHTIRPKTHRGDPAIGALLLEGHFTHARQTLDIGQQGTPWTVAAPSERFAHWLHSFAWLPDLLAVNDKAALIRARDLIDQWITIYGKWNRFSWNNDLIANRLFFWLSLWTPALQTDSLSESATLRRICTIRQLKRLRKTYHRTSPGLSRLRAAAVLVIGGARMSQYGQAFLAKGLDLLDDEIDAQILPDGGHISRNPETSFHALHILQTLDTLLQARGVEGSRAISRAIDRLIPLIAFFRHSDGTLATFNGGSEGTIRDLKAFAKSAGRTAKPFGYCPHTAFQRIEQNGTILIVDGGGSPPRPYDLEAHLAPLAFELSTPEGQMIVNCGWSQEQPQQWRRPMRATAAHSTLILNDQSAGRLLKKGAPSDWIGPAIAIDSGPARATRKEQVSGIWLESNHDGYRADTGLVHRRRIYMSEDGQDIRGEDSLALPVGDSPRRRDDLPFQIRFHLHPDVQVTLAQNLQSALIILKGKTGWRFRTDGGPLFLEPSFYLGKGDKPLKTRQIVITGRAFCDSDGESRSNRVRWSFRNLAGVPS